MMYGHPSFEVSVFQGFFFSFCASVEIVLSVSQTII